MKLNHNKKKKKKKKIKIIKKSINVIIILYPKLINHSNKLKYNNFNYLKLEKRKTYY
jgi:hypothetical protein